MTNINGVAAFKVIHAIAEAIRALGTVPNGYLYAQVMGTLSLENYNTVIKTLTRAGVVSLQNDELKWIGPVIK